MPKQKKIRYASETPARPRDWLDMLARLQLYFGRFTWDIGGVILVAFSFMILLALLNLTGGILLSFIAYQLSRWLGWGSYLVVIATGYSGYSLLRKPASPFQFRWGRIIALELAPFFGLIFLSLIGAPIANLFFDYSTALDRAELGMDGGRIGWALAHFLSLYLTPFWIGFISLLGVTICAVFGFGYAARIEAWIMHMAGMEYTPPEEYSTTVIHQIVPESSAQADARPEQRTVDKNKKPAQPLPPEYRKSFKVSDAPVEKAAKPLPRGERLPPLSILFGETSAKPDEKIINQTAGLIEKTLAEFGITAKVVGFRVGPTVTQFAVQPGFMKKGATEEDAQQLKVRVAQIASLQKDLALALSAERLRIEAPVPGRSYVGIEVPNQRTSVVRMRSVIESEAFNKSGAPLAIALGRDVSGQAVVADLARMPHLLIAGSTGSGKSVCITSLASCLAMNNTPEELRMVMIDSKMVELIRFNGLPHLLGKVETDINRIMGVLRWVVVEMEHRYRLLEGAKARDLDSYNRKLPSGRKDAQKPLPRIVVLIDELADLMMSSPDQTEHNLVRLAQMARATGIHLVVATQRPSTDVVTGLIKANFPARLAFAVASGVDSRVILDSPGAETLLGRGDLLFLNPEVGNPTRAQGVLVVDQEIERLISFWQKVSPVKGDVTPPWEALLSEPEEGADDSLIEQATQIVKNSQRASASLLQRRLRIGYPRAARLLDQLEELGVVGPGQGGGRERDVLIEADDDELNDEEE